MSIHNDDRYHRRGMKRCKTCKLAIRPGDDYCDPCWEKALERESKRRERALAAATGTAKTPTAAECEASQSGAKRIAQP